MDQLHAIADAAQILGLVLTAAQQLKRFGRLPAMFRTAVPRWDAIDRSVPGAETPGGSRVGEGRLPTIDRVPGRALCPGCCWRCR